MRIDLWDNRACQITEIPAHYQLERWFGEYQKHRLAFSSFEEFKEWYNNRPHGSLEFEHLETPEQAFRRKMRQEMYFAIGHRLFGL